MGKWMNRHGEAIYGTRPWTIFGEGPIAEADIAIKAQGFNEGAYTKATAEEIRFTQTPKHLYAIALAWPEDNKINVKSLAKDSKYLNRPIKKVELVGHGKVQFRQTPEGLQVSLPDSESAKTFAPVLKITR